MRIFVYGSLRHKQGNSHWMTNARTSYWAISVSITTSCIAWATIQAQFRNGTVHGEVYRIDNATLAELDALRTRAVNTRAS